MEGADGWQLSNVNVLSTAAHLASLEIFKDAGLDNLRSKSIKLTGFFEFIIQSGFSTSIEIITPKDPSERGCQLSLVINNGMGKNMYNLLRQQGVVADWREPDVIRVAPVPLYNTFEDVFRFGEILSKSSINQNKQ
jgi:kynureninase